MSPNYFLQFQEKISVKFGYSKKGKELESQKIEKLQKIQKSLKI